MKDNEWGASLYPFVPGHGASVLCLCVSLSCVKKANTDHESL